MNHPFWVLSVKLLRIICRDQFCYFKRYANQQI
jgi:hypothetical protein